MSILKVENLSHSFGDKKVFIDTQMQLFTGDKMGLTGLNGAGKSTLINILIGNVLPDDGLVRWNPKIRMGYLDQQAQIDGQSDIKTYLKGAFQNLFETQKKLEAIDHEISGCRDSDRMEALLEKLGEYQNTLETHNFFSINSNIEKVAAGLGIKAFGLDTPVGRLSGGQRAKVMLAKLLLESPDVLLLDEPTNFLDREHIEWLGKYLINFKGSFILVSHDFRFLNRVVNCICDIQNYTITRYNGTYESFVRQKEEKSMEYERSYDRQQKEITKLEDYIHRNLYRASTTKMAQSRRKKLEKMVKLEKPQSAAKPSFQFAFKTVSPKIILKVKNLEVGYGKQAILPKISMQLRAGDKVCVSGFNGIGKTTFLKTVCGMLPKVSGNVRIDGDAVIGYFEQENVWKFPEKTALEEIKDRYPRLKDKEARSWLARCGLKAEQAMQALSTLSGGEQAKVKLCKLVINPCNLLILDEPTNHMDINAIEQLQKAIIEFSGAVIFVSHNKAFCDGIPAKKLDMESLFD